MSTKRWLVWLAFVATWTTLLLLPRQATDSLSRLGDLTPLWKILIAKTLHVLGYATFAALTGWLYAPSLLRWALFGFLFVHAGATEALQLLVERGGSLRDVGLDAIGIAIGTAFSWKWWRRGHDRKVNVS